MFRILDFFALLALLSIGYCSRLANFAECESPDYLPTCRTPRAGCSSWRSLTTSDGLTRRYLIHLPDSYKASNTYPLILSFHGRTKNAQEQEGLSGFSDPAINDKAIAVYPQGLHNPVDQWQGDPEAAQNDVNFISELLDELESRYNIDDTHIFATGKSNGGGFMNLLACDSGLSSRIAAFAAVSGAFYANNTKADPSSRHPKTYRVKLPPCLPSNETRPIPFLEFHGEDDCTIFYAGGLDASDRGITSPVFSVVQSWADQAHCFENKSTIDPDCGIERFSWTCGDVEDAIVHYKIPNLQHDWPSQTPNDDCTAFNASCGGAFTTCINASTIIMEWLFNHPLPRETPESDSAQLPLEL